MAYDRLKDDGYLISKERSGIFVNPHVERQIRPPEVNAAEGTSSGTSHWQTRFTCTPSAQMNIEKPADWRSYAFPFIYGQLDLDIFPTNQWRECCRDAMSVSSISEWASDRVDADDSLLVEQIQRHLLPRRGVWTDKDQILITVGAQQALYMLVRLLLGPSSQFGLEDPGYVDIRNIAAINPTQTVALPVDGDGLILSDAVKACDCVYVTPSHQSPTTATMPLSRRRNLLQMAEASDFLIIEDDYESEIAFSTSPTPALKSLDKGNRVIYVGSLSKTLSPGLRLGYVVGPPAVIRELRALRRLMLRHPPANNQRAVALFLARGHHDSLTRRLARTYKRRSEAMREALDEFLPSVSEPPAFGGSSFWIRGEKGLDCRVLQERASQDDVLIEPGHVHFMADDPPLNFFRLGFSAIKSHKIRPGIKRLARAIRPLSR